MSDHWEKMQKQRELMSATYFSTEEFLKDLKDCNLRNSFRLAEPVFQCLIGMMAGDRKFAKLINDQAVVLLLMATVDKPEIESLLVMAETYADG
jgi:hypothetical protein